MSLNLEPNVFVACLAVFFVGVVTILIAAVWFATLVTTTIVVIAREVWSFLRPKRIAS